MKPECSIREHQAGGPILGKLLLVLPAKSILVQSQTGLMTLGVVQLTLLYIKSQQKVKLSLLTNHEDL